MKKGPAYTAAQEMKWMDNHLAVLDFNEAIRTDRKVCCLISATEEFDYLAYYVESSDWIVLEADLNDGSKRVHYRFFERPRYMDKFMDYFNASTSKFSYEIMLPTLLGLGINPFPEGLIQIRRSPDGIQYFDKESTIKGLPK